METQKGNPVSKKLSPDEEAQLAKMKEEEDAKAEAHAALNMQHAANAVAAVSSAARANTHPVVVAPQRTVGDIPVTCLKTEPNCRLGGRSYNLKKGAEVMMDPSHALELSQGEAPWIAPITVIQRRN